MRTTLDIDEALFEEAMELSGSGEKPQVIHEALRSLIAREASRRRAKLGGSHPKAWAAPRRRPCSGSRP